MALKTIRGRRGATMLAGSAILLGVCLVLRDQMRFALPIDFDDRDAADWHGGADVVV